ncbi:hypothetical protein LTR94_028501, partial [Friedmanniomyces endolithicus]
TTVTPLNGGTRIVADDNSLPDITARYVLARPWGEAQFSGLVRQLRYQNPLADIDGSTIGWGLSASAKLKVGAQDDIRLMITGGEGIGRYVGLNLANDAVVTPDGDLEGIPLFAGFAAYRHVWMEGWRSSLIYSVQEIDNDPVLTGLAVNRSAHSLRGNLIWSPLKGLDLGGELSFAERELESGANGDMARLHLFVKYGF